MHWKMEYCMWYILRSPCSIQIDQQQLWYILLFLVQLRCIQADRHVCTWYHCIQYHRRQLLVRQQFQWQGISRQLLPGHQRELNYLFRISYNFSRSILSTYGGVIEIISFFWIFTTEAGGEERYLIFSSLRHQCLIFRIWLLKWIQIHDFKWKTCSPETS